MNKPSHRRNARTEATRKALIDAAEVLFGRYGFHAVTVKDIGTAIGSKNKVVVAYHFGTKVDLVDAIYEERLPFIEARRAELLAELSEKGQAQDLKALLIALWRPLAEFTNSDNVHSYALFLGEMLREGLERMRAIVHEASPSTRALVDRICLHLPTSSGPVRDLRWQLASRLVLDAIRLLDETVVSHFDEAAFDQVFNEAVTMAMAALTAS